MQARTNIPKSLAGSSWVKDKETLTITYKAKSTKCCSTNNNGILNQDHLHRETNIVPMKEHNVMLSKQYTLTCHLPGHPSYPLVNQGPPDRNLRKYAAKEYKENRSFHTKRRFKSRCAINNYSTNPNTTNSPHPIDGSE